MKKLAAVLPALLAILTLSSASAQTFDFDGRLADVSLLPIRAIVAGPSGQNSALQRWASEEGVSVYSELALPIPDAADGDKAEIDGKTLWRGTQVNKGELVEVTEVRQDGWMHVNLPGQNYSGWIKLEQAAADPALAQSFRQVKVEPAAPDAKLDPNREAFLKETKQLEGVPYVWGGRSPKGVDCSGLVQLAFSYIGMGSKVPRTAHEQRDRSRPVDPKDLKPGDLIFTAHSNNPGKISHVVIYIGDGQIREAPQTGSVVKTADLASRLGVDLQSAAQGQKTGKYVVYFGTYFAD
jgi:cell wall-associated NlpC family hydrolase